MPEFTGSLSAEFRALNGRTRISGKTQTAPLKIAKSHPMESGGALVYIMDASPGMMAGDRYLLDFRLGEGARVRTHTQSFAKVHPSAERPCMLRQNFRVGKDAVLEWLPEPVMLYENASLSVTTDIDIDPGGILLMGEILCPGRSARNESFRYQLFDNKTTVRYGGELIYFNRLRIEPVKDLMTSPAAWGRYSHLGNLYMFSDRINPEMADFLSEALVPGDRLTAGIGLAYKHGILLSVAGHEAWRIREQLEAVCRIAGKMLGLERKEHL